MSATLYFCCDERRRTAVRTGGSTLNGIDFLEVGDLPGPGGAQRLLRVAFVRAPSPALKAAIGPDQVEIEGGDRVRGIGTAAAAFVGDELHVSAEEAGDFSTYTLHVRGADGKPLEGMDPLLSAVEFGFKAACDADADCLTDRACAPEPGDPPEIDYLAKDYASFRQLLLDRMALVLPGWTERNPADLGVTLVEVLAYVGDYLSYRQDAVATEAYLGTARQRVSVRRHARLLDYPMHDGCNARAWVHVEVATPPGADEEVTLPAGTRILTRVAGAPPLLQGGESEVEAAMGTGPEVFETMHTAVLRAAHNRFDFYAWGARECCLPKGATRATLAGHHPHLAPGDVLVLEEVLGARTGLAADADPAHRHAVRLTEASAYEPEEGGGPAVPRVDPAFLQATVLAPGLALETEGGGTLRTLSVGEVLEVLPPWAGTAAGGARRRWPVLDAAGLRGFVTAEEDAEIRLESPGVTEIAWDQDDALPFPLCVSAETARGRAENVSVARGNVVLADHGRTLPDDRGIPVAQGEPLGAFPAPDPRLAPAGDGECACGGEGALPPAARFRPRLAERPVTQAGRVSPRAGAPPGERLRGFDPAAPAAHAFRWEMQGVLPEVAVETDPTHPRWYPRRDLLGSDAFARELVAEVEDDGYAALRFGDQRHGERPPAGVPLFARYRVGNGEAGNVGADSLRHLVGVGTALTGRIAAVRNPLAAAGGRDPENLEHVRQVAPAAFRVQERAVSPDDYARMAERHPEVQRAQATLRWTGSWRTVFLTVDRRGGRPVDAAFAGALRRHLERYRMAGHDLEVDGPRFVPLEVEVFVCVAPGYFRGDVRRALRAALGQDTGPAGRGFFHPDNFTFGQPVFLSAVYAAVQAVSGVSWAEVRRFRRQGRPDTEALDTGELRVGRLEVARLDDDPNHPDHGVLRLAMEGGR
jgi:hypothetical protein